MMMMSAHHPGHVFSPHTFVHTTESSVQQQHQAMLAEDEAAAALCALPSTTNHTADLKAFQHIWAQIKDCSDRLHDLTTIATVTATAAPEAAPPTPALFPLLQQLLSLFNTFNSAVQPTPENTATASGQKRKLEHHEESDVAETAMLVVKHEHAEESESHDGQRRQKRVRRTKAKPETANLRCLHCGETDTPEWRRGPAGPKTLCNACGLQYAKFLREADKREKCRLPLSLVLNS